MVIAADCIVGFSNLNLQFFAINDKLGERKRRTESSKLGGKRIGIIDR